MQSLGPFLKSLRRRIDRRAERLGDYIRLQARLGHFVSQEEVAEALDVSRGWYSLLESGGRLRSSSRLIARIADVLMLSEGERAELFRLAMPEVALPTSRADPPTLQAGASEMLDTFSSLRDFSRKLWSVTTRSEALILASEYASSRFHADCHEAVARVGPCTWGESIVIGKPRKVQPLLDFEQFVKANCPPTMQDEMRFYEDLLTQPGDLLSRAEVPANFNLEAKFGPAIAHIGWFDLDFLASAVRTRDGFAAIISFVEEKSRSFTEVERAELSAIAQLVSHSMSSL